MWSKHVCRWQPAQGRPHTVAWSTALGKFSEKRASEHFGREQEVHDTHGQCMQHWNQRFHDCGMRHILAPLNALLKLDICVCTHAAFVFSSQHVCLGPPLSLVLHWSRMSSYRDGSTLTLGDSKCCINLYFIIIVRFVFITCIVLVSEQPSCRIRADAKVTHLRASSPECRAHWRLPISCCYVCRSRKQVWFAPPQIQTVRHCNSNGSSYKAPSCGLIELHSAPSKAKINQQLPLWQSFPACGLFVQTQTMPCRHSDTPLRFSNKSRSDSPSSCMNIYNYFFYSLYGLHKCSGMQQSKR